MRIIAGKYKGKILNTFKIDTTRPTSDMVREALFNILYSVQNKTFLDLFGGTGAVGLEAVSRGAKSVTIVDNNKTAIDLINKNVKLCGLVNVNIVFSNYLNALSKLEKENEIFDIVFIDPPYATDYAEKSLEKLKNSTMINKESIIVWEHDKTKLNNNIDGFEVVGTKRYGIKYLTILKKNWFETRCQ